MSFGALLENKRGTEIFGDHEDAYLYWGKISINPSSPERDLLRIPNHVPIITFYCSTAGSTCPFSPSKDAENACYTSFGKDGYRKIRSVSRNCNIPYAGGFDVYIFVKTEFVPLPRYGMALYRDEKIVFHTGRPPLRIMTFQSSSDGRYNFKAAVPPGHFTRRSSRVVNVGKDLYEFFNHGWSTSYRRGSQYHVSLNQTTQQKRLIPVGPSGPIVPPTLPSDISNADSVVPVIDGSYYDKYENI